MIAIRTAIGAGAEVELSGQASDIPGEGWWSVFVPHRIPDMDPGGVLVRVHKQTGEAEIEMSL
ncbi:MAG: hypothetical protein JWM59_4668 [Verrucomicrobiales bacterium]|nr:hypothetical protein [Verrucomicrobiales bacterium]